jgi:polyphenol oxidase
MSPVQKPESSLKRSRTQEASRLQVLRADPFISIAWLIHGFSTRPDGCSTVYGGSSLNLGFTKQDTRSAVERNRALFLRAVGASKSGRALPLVTLRQIHSDLIYSIDSLPAHPLTGDGLITRTPGIVLGILTADCLPVLLVDPKCRAVGIFHAGWRGTVKRIVEKGVGEMRRNFGSRSQELKAAVGPGIRACCYEVGPEVREQFESQFTYGGELFREIRESDPIRDKYPLLFLSARPPGHSELPKKLFLDLAEANRRQLVSAGVATKNISISPLCSSCRTDLLFSHRAEKGLTGRMMAAVGIRP